MHCQVRSPDQVLFEGDSTLVAARGTQGEFAVMDNHAPLLAALRSGALRVRTSDDHQQVFACFGGTLRVADDHSVTVLVDEAIPLNQIDAEIERLNGEEQAERRQILLQVRSTHE